MLTQKEDAKGEEEPNTGGGKQNNNTKGEYRYVQVEVQVDDVGKENEMLEMLEIKLHDFISMAMCLVGSEIEY